MERWQPLEEPAGLPSSPQLCSALANRALGEATLLRIDRELGNEDSIDLRLGKVRSFIDRLESIPLQYCDDGERWRIGLAVRYAERELSQY